MSLPSISVVTPTLNAASVLEECLQSIAVQDYPKELVEIIIADGGSTDQTLEIARKYGAKIYENPLRTSESGKAVGVKRAQGELVVFIDSDNILPDEQWLRRMVAPFAEVEIIGSEPWVYTWRAVDSPLVRYWALLGMNDPLCYFLGNYDRFSYLSGQWTGLKVEQEDRGEWIVVTLEKGGALPTIGANGTILRRSFLEAAGVGDYLFDIDLIAAAVQRRGAVQFAKVKVGIVHLYSNTLQKFARKQLRRIRDLLYHQKQGTRSYPWQKQNKLGLAKFILYTVTVFPLFVQALRGFFKKRDWAWFFHPLVCWITLIVYGWGRIEGFFRVGEMSRENWSQ